MRLGIAIAALLALAACGESGEPAPVDEAPASDLAAKVNVVAANPGALLGRDVDCGEMPGDYAALADMAEIELRDASGRVAAVSNLEPLANINSAGKMCAWSASFDDVKPGGDSYEAVIGDWESDRVTEADLAETPLSINAED